DGAVKLYKTSPEGKEVTVRLIHRGEIFGEVVLFEDMHYPVNAAALQSSRILKISRAALLSILEEEGFRNDFIAALMRKQRYLTERILHLSAFDVEERFFSFLSDQYGQRDSYHITLSKQDIAAAIGTLPETFSRMISRLKKRGIIEWKGKELRIRQELS
ncbi:MAG TPA: Crp/Fnr family transcriptional regulator, partial [Sediminispirochaeta sp.]|nr:Crp/Fnr family transcriptional regulator [Sediminispirochaeta sp.]